MTTQPDLFAATPAPVDHRCLGCGEVHADAAVVHLFDGTPVSIYSEAWRLECEARTVLRYPTIYKRQSVLAGIASKRGPKAADDLRRVMKALWSDRAEKAKAATE